MSPVSNDHGCMPIISNNHDTPSPLATLLVLFALSWLLLAAFSAGSSSSHGGFPLLLLLRILFLLSLFL